MGWLHLNAHRAAYEIARSIYFRLSVLTEASISVILSIAMRLDFSSSLVMTGDEAVVDGGLAVCWACISGKIIGIERLYIPSV